MGLSYLNKKVWHPGRMQNMEQVWLAEEKQKRLEKVKKENLKKLKEEQHIEHLKQLQAQSGLISQSAVEKMSWMYDWGHKVQQEKNVEDFLLGKTITEKDMQNPQQQFQQVYKEEIGNDKNEGFTLLHEDPLYLIQQMERKKKQEILNNPIQMNDIYSKIEAMTQNPKKELSEKEKRKLEKKEKKRRKKEKRQKEKEERKKRKKEKKKKERDNSRSNSSASSSLLSDNEKKNNKKKEEKNKSKRDRSQSQSSDIKNKKKQKKYSKSRSRSKSKENQKNTKPQSKHSQLYDQYLKSRLGTIMTQDKEGKMQYDFSINKKKFNTSQVRQDKLSAEERTKMLQKMQEDAQNLQEEKLEQHRKDFSNQEAEEEEDGKKYDPKFIHKMKNKIYEGKNQEDLADRLGRKKNYVSRKLDKDQLHKK